MLETERNISRVILPEGFSEPGPLPTPFYQSSVRSITHERKLQQLQPGIFVVENPYEGFYGFFPDRPSCFIGSDGKAYYPPKHTEVR